MKFSDPRSLGKIRKGNLTILKHQGHPRGGERVSKGTCARCHGFMVPSFTDALLVEIGDTSTTPAWRCVNCGNWIDATVAANQKHTSRLLSTASGGGSSLTRRRWRR